MTGSTKHIFHAFSAYVGQVTGRTTCLFWPDDPNDPAIKWDPAKLVPVDLSKTPSEARAGKITWDDVQVDDYTMNGGLTTIGPLFPGGHVIGGAWLHADYMKKVGLSEAQKPQHGHDHEFRAIVYAGDKTYGDRRFQGFHARVVGGPASGASSNVVRVQVWNGGHGRGGSPTSMWWVDTDAVCDKSESAVGPGGATEGSLYLDAKDRQIYLAGGGTGPKVPPAHGY
jgi:hypothetical protein